MQQCRRGVLRRGFPGGAQACSPQLTFLQHIGDAVAHQEKLLPVLQMEAGAQGLHFLQDTQGQRRALQQGFPADTNQHAVTGAQLMQLRPAQPGVQHQQVHRGIFLPLIGAEHHAVHGGKGLLHRVPGLQA